MKDTRIDNPNIIVKDSRILELNDIVEEVKESEEWEAVQMNFMEVCIEKGREQGLARGREEGMIQGTVELCCELGLSREAAVQKVMEKFSVEPAVAEGHVEKYWKR